jgi:diguanylate cyclase (GGDEF)-like protein
VEPRHVRWSLADVVPQDHDLLAARGLHEALVVPLRIGDTVAGHLLVADRHGEPQRFSDVDVRLLGTVANHAGVALTNAQLIERLHVEARRDELTGLPNRAFFREVLESTTAGTGAFAIMMIDFDGFKAINDTLGHSVGDELLRELAHRLDVAGGDDAVVARLGGDEFAVLSSACPDEPSAVALAHRLLAVFDDPVEVGGTRLRLGGSLGIALSPEHATSASDLMRHADVAMYAAKQGAGGARVFSHDLVEGDADVLSLGGDLKDAVERDEIEVVVHPLVVIGETGARRVHSVEVLARWRHPVRGEVPPATFFRAAEQAGITVDLSARILDRALRMCRAWLDDGLRVRVAVNTAPRWLADPGLPDQVAAALARHGVPADLLCLELTERSVIADPRRATATLQRLTDLGVHLAVDDFGTGYSSLTYLSRMPVDQLKIDETFVSRVGESDRDRAIVRSIVDLGHNLGLEVVAEGVSDPAVRAELEALGCRLAQGYLFAQPFAPSKLAQFLAEGEGEVVADEAEGVAAEGRDEERRPGAAGVPAQRASAAQPTAAADGARSL